jgi:ribosomal protein S18 acetylase RimI-like enzyme
MNILKLTQDIVSERTSELIDIDKVIVDDETWGYENFIMNLCGKWDNSYVLFINNEIAGYIVCSIKNKQTLHIHRLAVKKDYQKMGVGTHLINEVTKNIDKNIENITLMVHKDNMRAKKFYEKNKFDSACLVGNRNMYRRDL